MSNSGSYARELEVRPVNPWPLRRTAQRFALYVPTVLLVVASLAVASSERTTPLDARVALLLGVVVLGWTQLVGL